VPPLFLDTSALVRLYDHSERGARRLVRLCRGRRLIVCRLTRVELASALRRKQRTGELPAAAVARTWARFERERHARYETLPLGDDVLDLAAQLLARHTLRAYDAVQLASALRINRELAAMGVGFRFVTADRNQEAAATAEGLDVELID
jgi:predicted nucleic acid-binding protein